MIERRQRDLLLPVRQRRDTSPGQEGPQFTPGDSRGLPGPGACHGQLAAGGPAGAWAATMSGCPTAAAISAAGWVSGSAAVGVGGPVSGAYSVSRPSMIFTAMSSALTGTWTARRSASTTGLPSSFLASAIAGPSLLAAKDSTLVRTSSKSCSSVAMRLTYSSGCGGWLQGHCCALDGW